MARRSRRRGSAAVTQPDSRWLVPVWIGGVTVAATIERWWFPRAWDEAGLAASRFYSGDARAYLSYAAALAGGETFDNGVPFHPPGWPLVLSLVFRALGWSADSPLDALTIKHVVAILSGVSVGLSALLALALAGRAAMVIVSFLGTFHFGHMVQAASPNSEPLYGFLLVGVLLCGFWCMRTQSHVGFSLGWGVLAGFTILVRAEFAFCVALLAIAGVTLGARPARRPVACFLMGVVLALVPTTIVNWKNLDDFNRTREGRMPGPLPRFAPVTGYGAFNFANANHSAARGGFNFDLPSLLPPDGDDNPANPELADMTEAGLLDLSRPVVYRAYVDGYQMGLAWLALHPAQAVTLLQSKLSITTSMFDYGYFIDNRPVAVRGTRRPVDQIDLGTSWLTFVHLGLALFGAVLACRSGWSILLLAPVLTMLASSALFFGYVRLGVAYLPVVWILQAMAIGWLLRRIPVSEAVQRRGLLAAAALGVMLLLHEAAASGDQRVLMIDGMVDESGQLVDDQALEIDRVR